MLTKIESGEQNQVVLELDDYSVDVNGNGNKGRWSSLGRVKLCIYNARSLKQFDWLESITNISTDPL